MNADWIAVDWGTSNLRVWGMSGAEILWHESSDKGMGTLSHDQFEPALLDLIASHLGQGVTQVVACGMVGARQGWIEAGYRAVPCTPLGSEGMTAVPTSDPRLSVHIIGGLKQMSPADVMRGEETQIAGFQALNPQFDGVICLPGSHSKWAHVSAKEVVSFQTFMTGEMFAALSGHTVLQHSIPKSGWDDAAFLEAVSDAMSRPEKLAGWLFSIRSASLLTGLSAPTARARLSGWLIGAELAAARPYWLGQQVAVIGVGSLAAHYITALSAQGVAPIQTDNDTMTLKGLYAARQTLKDSA